MASGHRDLAAHIARLRALKDVPGKAAETVAVVLEEDLKAQVESGRGPNGETLQPTADGRRPFAGASKHIEVGVVGNTVIATLGSFHMVLHHLGKARGRIKRAIIPSKLNRKLSRKIRVAVTDTFRTTYEAG
jgi:hypothetical protein